MLEFLGWLLLSIFETVVEWLIIGLIWEAMVAIGWRGMLVIAGVVAGLILVIHVL